MTMSVEGERKQQKHPLWWKRGGQSTVEMALLLPIVLVCLLGTLDMGRAVYAYVTLSHAVREGCRAAVVQMNSDEMVIQTVVNAGIGLNLTPGSVTITGSRQPGTTVTVTAVSVYRPVTPILSQVVGNAIQLTASSSMIVD